MKKRNPKLLDSEQFEFIADSIHASGDSRIGCRRMLVDGISQCDVARELDVLPSLLAGSVKNYREFYAKIKRLFIDVRI